MKKISVLLLIFMLALTLRLAAVYMDKSGLETDEGEYDRLALNLAAGKGYINSTDGAPTSLRPPLYPVVLALIYKVFGYNILAVRLIQALIGSFTVILLYGIAYRIFGSAVAFLTGISASFYMTFVTSTGLLHTETLSTFLIVLISYLIMTADEEKPARLFFIGILCGLSTLMKSSTFFIPILAVAAVTVKSKIAHRALSRAMFVSALLLLFFGLTLLPWTIRNYKVFGRPALISTNSGLNFYQGLMKSPKGIFDLEPKSEISIKADTIKNETERSAFFTKEALKIYKNKPLFALKMLLLRFLFFWNIIDWEILGGDVINYHYLFFFPFFIFGMIRSIQKRKDVFVPIAMIAVFVSLTLLFPGTPRYRMPADGYIIILASYGLYEFVMKNGRKLAAGAFIALYWSLCFFAYLYSVPVKYALRDLLSCIGLWRS